MGAGHHLDANSKRAILLGAMDGVVSNLGIVIAFTVGSFMVTEDVFQSGLIGMLTGAVSMFWGELGSVTIQKVAMKSCGNKDHEVSALKAGISSFLAFSVGAFIIVFPLIIGLSVFFSIIASALVLGLIAAILAPVRKIYLSSLFVGIAILSAISGYFIGYFVNLF